MPLLSRAAQSELALSLSAGLRHGPRHPRRWHSLEELGAGIMRDHAIREPLRAQVRSGGGVLVYDQRARHLPLAYAHVQALFTGGASEAVERIRELREENEDRLRRTWPDLPCGLLLLVGSPSRGGSGVQQGERQAFRTAVSAVEELQRLLSLPHGEPRRLDVGAVIQVSGGPGELPAQTPMLFEIDDPVYRVDGLRWSPMPGLPGFHDFWQATATVAAVTAERREAEGVQAASAVGGR